MVEYWLCTFAARGRLPIAGGDIASQGAPRPLLYEDEKPVQVLPHSFRQPPQQPQETLHPPHSTAPAHGHNDADIVEEKKRPPDAEEKALSFWVTGAAPAALVGHDTAMNHGESGGAREEAQITRSTVVLIARAGKGRRRRNRAGTAAAGGEEDARSARCTSCQHAQLEEEEEDV